MNTADVSYQVETFCKLGVFELLVKDYSAGRKSRYEDDGRLGRVSSGVGPELGSIL